MRTIQRIEAGEASPRLETLQAIAAAFDTDVAQLLHGYSDIQLSDVAERFVCPTCGAPLEGRTFVEHEYGDCEYERFACGHTRGWQTRPCPKDPAYPAFEEYDAEIFDEEQGGCWCHLRPRTDAARLVSIPSVRGRSRELALVLARRAYIEMRDGYAAAEEFGRLFDLL